MSEEGVVYAEADLVAARRVARVAREKARLYRGTSEQMRRKLEARAAMAETEAALIAYALGEGAAHRQAVERSAALAR